MKKLEILKSTIDKLNSKWHKAGAKSCPLMSYGTTTTTAPRTGTKQN